MEIYHTETQEDYDALMAELEAEGVKLYDKEKIETSEIPSYFAVYKNHTCIMVDGTTALYNPKDYYELLFPNVPITKYKAEGEKMRFTEDNVNKLFSKYRKDSDYSLSDLQDGILNLDDAQEKVVVPKYVALFYENVKHYKLEEVFNQFEKTSDREVSNWYFNRKGRYDNNIANAQETIAKMHLYGYEIEKEQLYEVVIHETEDDRFLLIVLENGGYKFEFESDNEGFWKQRHTESEIKKMDKRYWAFAVPVEEEK